LLSPRRRDDKALDAVICQAWIDGVSTRKVDQLVRALGKDTGISRSTVSRICSEIDEAVQEFLTRRVAHTWFPSLFLDATDLDVRHRGRVVPQALVVATDADPEGVALVTSDAHAGSVGDFVCGGFGVICAAWAAREEKMSHAMNTDTTITMEDGGRVDMRSGVLPPPPDVAAGADQLVEAAREQGIDLTGPHERCELGFVVRGTKILEDLVTSSLLGDDLHRRRT
jgi:hypothetical protein